MITKREEFWFAVSGMAGCRKNPKRTSNPVGTLEFYSTLTPFVLGDVRVVHCRGREIYIFADSPPSWGSRNSLQQVVDISMFPSPAHWIKRNGLGQNTGWNSARGGILCLIAYSSKGTIHVQSSDQYTRESNHHLEKKNPSVFYLATCPACLPVTATFT